MIWWYPRINNKDCVLQIFIFQWSVYIPESFSFHFFIFLFRLLCLDQRLMNTVLLIMHWPLQLALILRWIENIKLQYDTILGYHSISSMNVSKMEYVSTIRGLFVVKMRNTYDEHLMKGRCKIWAFNVTLNKNQGESNCNFIRTTYKNPLQKLEPTCITFKLQPVIILVGARKLLLLLNGPFCILSFASCDQYF